MATLAIYYDKNIPEEKKTFLQKSTFTIKGHDKFCNDVLKNRNIEVCPEDKTLICRLYEYEVSPHHLPILGFVDIFIDENEKYYSRVTLCEGFEDNEGLLCDLETDANTFSLSMSTKPFNFCHKI